LGNVIPIWELPVRICPYIYPVTLADTDLAVDLYSNQAKASKKVGVRDSIHVAVMKNNGIQKIASYDTGFDNFKGISRFKL
jgi:predicted nucleic acid-binding protein